MAAAVPHFALPDLRSEVLSLLRQIPRGRVTTYGDLARALGDEQARSARWLGEFLKNHPHDPDCACHRVVRATGELGFHVSGDPRQKALLLQREGVAVSCTGHVDLAHRCAEFESSRPLEQLRTIQEKIARNMRQAPLPGRPRTFAGLDVAYRDDGRACGAYVELDAQSLQVTREVTVTMQIDFPYIPGYLTFREMPVMLELCRRARDNGALADVLFVDGNGLLHPWRAGIAVCVGVLLDHPTIGIGKSLLCGTVDLQDMTAGDRRPVIDNGALVGTALKSTGRSRPVYASPGNRITIGATAELAQRTMTAHRVPEPIYWADRLTKELKPAAPLSP